MKAWLSLYRPHYAEVLVYMLQSVEYRAGPYLRWYWRTSDFERVMQRRTLERTRPARLLLAALRTGMFLQAALGIACLVQWWWQGLPAGWPIGLALLVSYPVVWAQLVTLPLWLGAWLVVGPRQRRAIARSAKLFAGHPGRRIAIAGSYGKTTMKEVLQTVLGETFNVAATPDNKNVAISHARFAAGLSGDEDLLIIEYGEGKPGDISRFAKITQPTHAIITGLAPAHLDRYKTLAAVAMDLLSLERFVPAGQLYVQATDSLKPYFGKKTSIVPYDTHGVLGWKVQHVEISATQTTFTMSRRSHTLQLTTGLLGKHNLAAVALAAALGMELGMSEAQVVAGVAKTKPFEHRMQPRELNGAVLIDDTYNGNLEGVRAGTALLKALPATRKWYVTPGLVDQGRDSTAIHRQLGALIAGAQPDRVVLMANSACQPISQGLRQAGYTGDIQVETDPLAFYTNLPHFVAAGDVIMMQNDWTDNYA